MRMAADELFTHFRSHVIEIETTCLLGDFRMKNHLKQNVAQLLLHLRPVVPLDGVHHFIGFLNHVGNQGMMGLFRIPGAALGSAQAFHDGDEALHLPGRLVAFDHFSVVHDRSHTNPARADD